MIYVKRVYEDPAPKDGARILVERVWPRGVKKESLKLHDWNKDAAPSRELRQWFNHDPSRWNAFQRRYRAELDRHPEAWQRILETAEDQDVTLLFSSRDTEHNNVVALKTYLDEKKKKH